MVLKKGFKELQNFGLTKVAIARMFGTNEKQISRVLDSPADVYGVTKVIREDKRAKTMKVGL